MHQKFVTRHRDADLNLVPQGIDITDPGIDSAQLVRAQGVESLGLIRTKKELVGALSAAARIVRDEAASALIDAVLPPPQF